MKKELGYTALEMITVVGMVGVMAAVATPSVIRASRSYKLNEAAQQVSQAFQSAKNEAVRTNSNQTVLFDPANNTITINGRVIKLSEGITFETASSSNEAPAEIQNAATMGGTGAVTDQQVDATKSVSFPRRSDNKYEANFNSRGMPNVQPGAINWIYLVNSNGEKVAITLSSAGSTNTWKKRGNSDSWKDLSGRQDSHNSGSGGSSSSNSGSGS